jgi:hypothetical protein
VRQGDLAAGNRLVGPPSGKHALGVKNGCYVVTEQKEAPLSGVGVLVRLYWMVLGNGLLMLLLFLILDRRPALPSPYDAAYLLIVASLIIVRHMDIRFLNGQTGEGKPATMAHWRRYVMIIGPVGVGAWCLARLIVPA